MQAFIRHNPGRSLLLGLSAASAVILGAALVSQYGFGLHPCHLCLLQRYPYAAIIVIGLLGGAFLKTPTWVKRLAWLCVLLLLIDAGIAFYHSGVELGWFPGPSGCTTDQTGEQTLEEMRAAIMNAPLVSCDQAMIHVLGLSMAAWNALAAGALAIGSTVILCRLRRKA